ncbi:hypothetical protein LCGC14_1584310 [marine sediment metagenome]|uniref:Uncharacterized protein n=1 Tax=marine sediment metagenome TaxID=412755 RepID=A0A0F9KWI8_9ZZZZ
MEYQITQKQCQSSIRGVCSYCGGKLEPIETVDNSRNPTYWSGCKPCGVVCWGVSPTVYAIAKRLVTERNYKHYTHLRDEPDDTSETIKYNQRCQISGTCGLVSDVLSIHAQEAKNET